jgi:hypothetical protein
MQRTFCGALIGIVSCAVYRPALPAAQGEWPYVGGNNHFGANDGLYLQAYALPQAP